MNDKKLWDIRFVRKFSTCMFKNRKLALGEMEFSKDFINTENRGDKYPVFSSKGDFSEEIKNGEYFFSSDNGGGITRLIGHMSPFAVYEAVLSGLDGECGFAFENGDVKTVIAVKSRGNGKFSVICGEEEIAIDKSFDSDIIFSVLPQKTRFDVYIKNGEFPECIGRFNVEGFENSLKESFFLNTSAGLYCSGGVRVKKVSVYMDSGISQADIRTVRYENGEVLTENGKIFFTVSIRLEEGGYQGVFSWVPGTEEFELTGALFFDAGDGAWCNDVASSLIFSRKMNKWLLWVCSFSHGHILGHSEFFGEPRYGKNVIDITLVPALAPDDDDTVFGGKSGDEDPDLYYDEEKNKWYLSICRVPDGGRYRYFFFESDSPFGGFVCVGSGIKGSETGGSFVKYNGTLYFVCGNSFEDHSDYRVYEWGDFEHPKKLIADYPDGGFRGWGTVFTVNQGTREKLYWLTFDRHKGSDWNWSYGNLYCFEGMIRDN